MSAIQVRIEGWTLEKILGTGGFGIVELWAHKSGNKVAIKRSKWDTMQLTPMQQRRWINELQTMKRLRHPNIVKALDLPFKHPDEKVDLPILCMEFCKKGDLRKILNKGENCCGITEREAIRIMKDISSAVEYLHSNNITHRDLKPENIVLQGEHDISYKLIDLGYAKDLGEASACASIVGTLNYIAPELLWKERYSCSVDYWSLGILFYELVTGIRPFIPKMQHTMTWMKHIRNKGYDDICAFESDGNIIFGQDIMDPTNLSRCLRNKLVEWFRVVLQWDPKKRGKQYDENGMMQLVVFKLLDSILSKQIIYVFSASLYKIYAYEVVDTTKISDLQSMIEKDTNISINLQTITEYFGEVLTDNKTPVLSQIQNPVLFVFENGTTLMGNSPPDIPTTLKKMIELSRNELEFETLMDYYRIAIFFIKREVYLFQLYIFAITIKVDLLVTRVKAFNENIKNVLINLNTLLNKLSTIRAEYKNGLLHSNKGKALEINFEKVTKLVKATDQIRLKFNPLIQEFKEIENMALNIDCTKDLSQICDKAVKLFELHKDNHKGAKPTEMVKLISEFMEVQQSGFIITITKQIAKLELDLEMLERIFDSVIAMATQYYEDFQSITQSVSKHTYATSNKEQNSNTSVHAYTKIDKISVNNDTPEISNEPSSSQFFNTSVAKCNENVNVDSMIYDNLVIRHTLDNLLIELQKKYMEVVSVEP